MIEKGDKQLLYDIFEQNDIIKEQNRLLFELIKEFIKHCCPKNRTTQVGIQFTGVPKMPLNALSMQVGQQSTATIIPLLPDGKTPSQGSVSAVTYNFSDPSATFTLNADGVSASVVGVSETVKAPASGSVSCTVTDPDGTVNSFTQDFVVTVVPVPPPVPITASIAVEFSTPTAMVHRATPKHESPKK